MNEVIREELSWKVVGKQSVFYFDVSASMRKLRSYTGNLGAAVRYGDRILLASAWNNGTYAAVYEFVDDDRFGLIWVGGEIFKDAGHALEACVNWCRFN